MKFGIKTALLALCLMAFSAGVGVINAQEASDAGVVQRDRLAEEITSLKKTYRGQLTEYLQAEREFVIARSQYQQLQTLASIDKVTLESKEVMTSRIQVLQTYFLLLKTSLIEQEGIELAFQEKTIGRIEETEEWLKSHQAEVDKTSDRVELDVLAESFTEVGEALQLLSDHSIALIATGKLQNIYDQILSVESDVFSETTTGGEFEREQRETKRVMTEISLKLKEVWDDMREDIMGEFDSLSISTRLVNDLNPAYTGLNKALGFVFEVIGL